MIDQSLLNLKQLSEKIARAVRLSIDLESDEEVFSGNEELLFLDALFKRMPNSSSKAPQAMFKIEETKDLTYFSFFDIWNDEVIFRGNAKNKKSPQARLISFAASILNRVRRIRSILFLEKSLQKSSSIIHIYSHLRNEKFIVPNLTQTFFKASSYEKNEDLRKQFYLNLVNEGVDQELSKYLSSLFPLSHLELFDEFRNHRIAALKIKIVTTTIYGVLEDPLMSFLIRNASPKLIYVQHGGGYGLNYKRLMYEIEELGSDEMYYWGTGQKNVFPTRFKSNGFRRMNNKSFIILSERKNSHPTRANEYIDIAENMNDLFGKKTRVVAYPSANFDSESDILQYGISYPEHERAKLTVYDSIRQSLVYARILTQRPFLISDEMPIHINNNNAEKFVDLLRSSGLLVPREELFDRISFWLSKPIDLFESEFKNQANDLFNHVLNQKKLNDLVDDYLQ